MVSKHAMCALAGAEQRQSSHPETACSPVAWCKLCTLCRAYGGNRHLKPTVTACLNDMRSDEALIGGAEWIELEKFSDPHGSLTPIESERHIPFAIKRIFY